MSQFGGVERPGPWETAGDHERRIRALEALRPCCEDSGGACPTWGECVLARTSIEFYWPCSETSGNLVDLVQGLELEPVTEAGFPTYSNAGPLEDTAVGFASTSGLAGNEGRFQVPVTDGSPSILDIIGGTNPFTIESWVYTDAIHETTNNRIVHCWSGAGSPTDGALFVDAGSIEDAYVSALRDGSGVGSSTDSPYALDTWTFWRATYDGATLDLYVNDVLVDTIASAGPLDNLGAMMVLGNNEGSAWTPLNGRVAHLAIYSDAVTEFCTPCPGGNASEFQVLTADGQGGTYWDYPTLEVEY